MDWKDTVMTSEELDGYWLNPDECDDEMLAEAQAEISFKAGIITGTVEGKYDGRREVVETMFNESYGDPRVTGYYKISYEEWQAKLKEWGIKSTTP